MPRKRIYTVLLLAMTVGAVFAFSTYRYVQATPTAGASAKTTPVVVAASGLDLGAALRAEDMRTINWPSDAVPAGTFSSPQELVGRGLIQPVSQNEPLLPSKLAPIGSGAGLPPMIPDGMRAMSVRVNDVIGVAGYVLPGTRVDVVATASPNGSPHDATSKVVLSNVQVLTAGTRMEQDQEKGKPMAVTVVTLLVYPEQSERLALASTEGKIQLALRNPLDTSAPETPGIKTAGLLGSVKAAPAKSAISASNKTRKAVGPVTPETSVAAPLPTVEMIRGDKRSSEVIK